MSRTIVIEPVTRIEGHAKVSVHVDDAGHIERAVLHVNEFRGFEKFCEGRIFTEMIQITPRICGICPVSHHLVSAKACDMIIGVTPPRPAWLLRELMHMGQVIQSHSMHFFELAGPDLLLGFDTDPATRNVAGLAAANPALAAKAIQLRKFGQSIIAALGERRIHPNFAVPGGVNRALSASDRDELRKQIPAMIGYVKEGLAIWLQWAQKNHDEVDRFANFESPFMGMVNAEDALELYDGPMKIVDQHHNELLKFPGKDYLQHIGEHVESWSYLKFPFAKSLGWPQGAYRVGPLGRLHAATHISTPLAQAEFERFHAVLRMGSLHYHEARLIEDLYALERAAQLLDDAEIISTDTLVPGRPINEEGVGVLEAPRGTLIHHYRVDEQGRLTGVNLIVATGHNNHAMCQAVDQVARMYVDPNHLTEGMLNRVEAAIRAYDPCLSCSTHALGQMPVQLEVIDPSGQCVGHIARSR